MSEYAPFSVSYEYEAFGLSAQDPSSLGNLRVYSAAPAERGVVFLHGVGQSWASWTPALQAARDLGIETSSWVISDQPRFGVRLRHVGLLHEMVAAAV